MTRWGKFAAVGALGILVQLAALALLRDGLRLHYLAATALAVEAAVLHNFVWHQRWTWSDRFADGSVGMRLLRFHIANGTVSILSNVVLMSLFTGVWKIHYLAANLLAIACTAVLNFLLCDRAVFTAPQT